MILDLKSVFLGDVWVCESNYDLKYFFIRNILK